MTTTSLISRTLRTDRHTTHYLEAGPADGPLIVLVHGWPSTGLIWRAQLEELAADGWHCAAPDLRGFGSSSVPAGTDAYAVEEVVADMAELHDHLGGKAAVWVGHDWGSIVVGALAAHEPARARAVVLASWAYFPDSNALATLVPLVDRDIYPADTHPDGQWDYVRHYQEHFERAVTDLDADPAATLASAYRPGDPTAAGSKAPTAEVTHRGGRFGAAHRAPPTPPHPALWPSEDFDALVRSFVANGFRGSCAYYVNDEANRDYARRARDGGRLSMPVLFVDGAYDLICGIAGNHQGDAMREACDDLTVARLPAGHWLPLEQKAELARVVRGWLAERRL